MIASDKKTQTMKRSDVAVAIYNSHDKAEAAIEELEHSGFDMQAISIIDRQSRSGCDRWGHQCTGLHVLRIPLFSIHQYETALEIDKTIVIARWSAEEVSSGLQAIRRTNAESVDDYHFSSASSQAALTCGYSEQELW